MSVIHHPHDKLASKLLEDRSIAASFLKRHLPPKALAKLDLLTLTPSSETAVTDQWKKLHNDIVFHCKTKEKGDAYVYLLIEHQSTPDRLMPLRILRYKLNLLGKYLDQKNVPEKVPNIVSLVLYHGEKEYPYKKDIFSCFEDKELAVKDIAEPMLLLDLADTPEDVLLHHGGADTLLKLLLKYSRKKDFIRKIQSLMDNHRNIFVSLSVQQASFIFEYILHIGKGNPKNAALMKESINQVYGTARAEKIFSLADYFRQEAREEGRLEGEREAIQKLLQRGIINKEQANKALNELK